MCIGVVPAYVPVYHICTVSAELRRGSQIPGSVSYRQQTVMTHHAEAGN